MKRRKASRRSSPLIALAISPDWTFLLLGLLKHFAEGLGLSTSPHSANAMPRSTLDLIWKDRLCPVGKRRREALVMLSPIKRINVRRMMPFPASAARDGRSSASSGLTAYFLRQD
ncbi:hypothetical protein BDZ45DRAFT_669220 [Acephala macrosclerotiorum]|nr:hypothetical protein BDZ45DRAFT_669220 [Acephala macrosclerotiorum]